MRMGRYATVVLATTLGTAVNAFAVDVTTCGQHVAAGSVGVLVTDLDCTTPYGVVLEGTSTLQLNGHVLRGGTASAVICAKGKCVVQGPGEIRDTGHGVGFESKTKGVVEGVDFIDTLGHGVRGQPRSKLQLSNVSFLRSTVQGSTIRATGITIVDADGPAVAAAYAPSIMLENGSITGGSVPGVRGTKVKLENVDVIGMDDVGVHATQSLRILDGVITGNDTTGTGIDVLSTKRPRVIRTTCGRSADENGASWGVCTND